MVAIRPIRVRLIGTSSARAATAPAGSRPHASDPSSAFTLIELMIVMAIIAILATIAVPAYVANVKHAREAVLHEDLATIRSAIEQYTYDKQKAPQSGDDLVQSGYLREMPKDPFTHRIDTWIFDQGTMLTSIEETQGGIDNVHSGSQEVSTEGNTYSTW
jgi:general secretion pathway protein G